MNIKLNARLSAYSKVDSIQSGECSVDTITNEQIDELFEDLDNPQSVKKDEIDTLFKTQEEPESVSKDEIDNLFVDEDHTVTSVSYNEIDSLFN